MNKGLIFKTLREIRGYESVEAFSKVSGLDVQKIIDVESDVEKPSERFFIWLEASKRFINHIYSAVEENSILEAELKNFIKKQLTSEVDEKMKNKAGEAKAIFAVMQVKLYTQTELAQRLDWSSSYISSLLTLDKSMSLEKFTEMADVIGVKNYEFMEMEEKFRKSDMSYLDVLDEVIKCIQGKNDSCFRKK